jgi:hypothetical protein
MEWHLIGTAGFRRSGRRFKRADRYIEELGISLGAKAIQAVLRPGLNAGSPSGVPGPALYRKSLVRSVQQQLPSGRFRLTRDVLRP